MDTVDKMQSFVVVSLVLDSDSYRSRCKLDISVSIDYKYLIGHVDLFNS